MSGEQTRFHVKRREFLNEDEAMPGFVIGIVQDTSGMPDNNDGWRYGTIILDFGDCYRRVSFSFDLSEEIPRRESLRKINIFAEVVNAVRDPIEKEVESRTARSDKFSKLLYGSTCVTKQMKAERNVVANTLRGTLLLRMANSRTLAKHRVRHPEGSLPSSRKKVFRLSKNNKSGP